MSSPERAEYSPSAEKAHNPAESLLSWPSVDPETLFDPTCIDAAWGGDDAQDWAEVESVDEHQYTALPPPTSIEKLELMFSDSPLSALETPDNTKKACKHCPHLIVNGLSDASGVNPGACNCNTLLEEEPKEETKPASTINSPPPNFSKPTTETVDNLPIEMPANEGIGAKHRRKRRREDGIETQSTFAKLSSRLRNFKVKAGSRRSDKGLISDSVDRAGEWEDMAGAMANGYRIDAYMGICIAFIAYSGLIISQNPIWASHPVHSTLKYSALRPQEATLVPATPANQLCLSALFTPACLWQGGNHIDLLIIGEYCARKPIQNTTPPVGTSIMRLRKRTLTTAYASSRYAHVRRVSEDHYVVAEPPPTPRIQRPTSLTSPCDDSDYSATTRSTSVSSRLERYGLGRHDATDEATVASSRSTEPPTLWKQPYPGPRIMRDRNVDSDDHPVIGTKRSLPPRSMDKKPSNQRSSTVSADNTFRDTEKPTVRSAPETLETQTSDRRRKNTWRKWSCLCF
ncbi:hypothetical protein BCR34DRAFT_592611 [Clohesyomyces aquaticus]|uniref:Uncharacterized protein n=1 Tax=Clohesyomyces aquaticus TaxID=1231657 RepID=A0A1Y1YQK3_9PLEO|nr:hypothetical protein BCR34DRAFT_592611 [Clohesyomyces aquaticus]